MAWGALIPLLAELDAAIRSPRPARGAFRTGYAFGFAFYLIGAHWIARLSNVAITVPWLKYPAWVMAAAYLGLFSGLTAWVASFIVRRSGVGLAAAFPVAAVAVEELRASGELGFPWFQPGYTQHAYAPVIQLASLGGVTLVTAWVVCVNVLLWRAWTERRRAIVSLAAAVLVAPWVYGAAVLARAPAADGPAVGLIQGDIPGELKWSGLHQREILDRFIDLSERAARHALAPRLIIWPETATGSYLRRQPDQTDALEDFVARTGVSVFTGFPDYELGPGGRLRYFNAGGLFGPEGPPATFYAKRHLVPFGERMPFQWLIPALGRIDLGQAEWTPGRDARLFPGGPGRFGCLVCFESIFPDLAREDVRNGANWIVNITNDEWFGPGAALPQHAAMAVFRAVENHVPLARCANTGITMVVDAYGRVVARAPTWTPAILVARLPAPGPPTPFTRFGDWPGLLALAACLGLAGRALTRRFPRA